MDSPVKIAICGAGPVGQTLALLLVKQGIAPQDLLLIDAKTSEQASQDARSIALSYGSAQILASIDARPQKATAIHDIHVSRRRQFGRTLIHAAEYKIPALGYVARYGDIIAPLESAIKALAIPCLRPVHVVQIEDQSEQEYLTITLANGKQISANIVIQAEGGIFSEQEQRTQHVDYQQTAIIAHVKTSRGIAHRAFERFTDQGPIALLPQDDGYSLVWCLRPDSAAHFASMSEPDFLRELQIAFGDRVGQFLSSSKRATFVLGLNTQIHETTIPKQRTVKIGNAAQTLHPVAGQGLNLGLRDAVTLAKCLAQCPLDVAIAEFIKLRNADRRASIKITDMLARIFASSADDSVLQMILGCSLGVVDVVKPLKKLLAEQMMFGWR